MVNIWSTNFALFELRIMDQEQVFFQTWCFLPICRSDGTFQRSADENDAGLFARPMKVGGFGTACDRERRGLVLSKADLCDPTLQYFRLSAPHNRNNPRGICLLINQRDFDREKTGQERRDGTDVDADAIERTFIKLGYSVNRATNLTLRKMQMLLSNG
ncbi:Caspase-7 [Sparganum proliferum]